MAGSAKKKNTAGNKKKGGKQKKNLRHEFQGVLLIAVGVILLACLIMGDSAVVPRYINMVLLGSFGLLAYVIPVLFAVFGVFRIILKKITITTKTIFLFFRNLLIKKPTFLFIILLLDN